MHIAAKDPESGHRVGAASAPLEMPRAPRRALWRDPLLRRMLALADATAALAVSFSLALVPAGLDASFWSATFLPAWIVLAKVHGLYDRDHRALRHLTVDELPSILLWALTGTALVALLVALTPAGPLSLRDAVQAWAVAAAAAFVLRGSARFVWRRLTPRERTIIVGSGPLVESTRRKLDLFPDIHVVLVDECDVEDVAVLAATPERLADVDRVILASHAVDERLLAELIAFCRRAHVKLSIVPPAQGIFGAAVRLHHVADLPVLDYNMLASSRSTLLLKRTLDVVVALGALVMLSPLFLAIGLAIRLTSRGPIIFAQRRAGRGGRPFRVYKFRTMVSNAEELLSDLVPFDNLRDPMFKLRRDPRVTRVGRLLRRTSLDELPQLVNVLKGEMSLVGPRPEQVELVERYEPEHRFRLAVKPGVTGPMQVFGRGELTFEERLAVEREYVENLSLGRDLRILAMTVAPVVTGRGAF